jgi:subtilisin family serine protease
MYRKTPYLVVVLTLAVLIPILSGEAVNATTDAVPNQAIVTLQGRGAVDIIAKRFDAVVVDSIPELNTYLFALPEKGNLDSLLRGLTTDPAVDTSVENDIWNLPETDQISQGFPDENVPAFVRGESPPAYYEQGAIYEIGLDSAQLLATGAGVTVAVIDNGIVRDHPLIAASDVSTGYDFIDNDGDPSEAPGLMYGHGTFVTGIVLVTAPQCRILPLRAFNGEGQGQLFNIMRAIIYAKNNGAHIINMSFSAGQTSPLLNSALNFGGSNQPLMVASVGNDSAEVVVYPAAHPNVMAVSAVNADEYLATFSNYGSYVELCAPGVDVYSALPAAESGWGTWSGTSFAAPFVAGVAALSMHHTPNRPVPGVRQLLTDAAREDLAWGSIVPPDIRYGWGLVDAWETLASLSVGDLDGSGQRDSTDLQLLIAFLSNGEDGDQGSADLPTGMLSPRLADVDCDGKVTIQDLASMARLLNTKRWEKVIPCVKP